MYEDRAHKETAAGTTAVLGLQGDNVTSVLSLQEDNVALVFGFARR
jgi:hypothetical protein